MKSVKNERPTTGRHRLPKERQPRDRSYARTLFGGVGCAVALTGFSIMSAPSAAEEAAPEITTGADFPCDPATEISGAPRILIEQGAEACNDLRMGKIAIIGYSIPADRLQQIADNTKLAIDDAYDGLLRPEVTPIIASPEADYSYQGLASLLGCFNDSSSMMQTGSEIAKDKMELQDFDYVISVSTISSCRGENYKGRASKLGGDTADIYGAKPELIDARGLADSEASTIAHEYDHMQNGVGHAGKLYPPGSMPAVSSRDKAPLDKYPLLPTTQTVDLRTVIESQVFYEYGDTANIMGNFYNEPSGLYVNSVQRHYMEWTDRVLDRVPDHQKIVNDENVFIELSPARDHDFAVLMLNPSLQVTGSVFDGKLGGSNIFEKLVFDPVVTDSGPLPLIQVYLASTEEATCLTLGYVDTSIETQRTFTLAGHTVSLTVTPGGFNVANIK